MRKLFFPLAAAMALTSASILPAHTHASLEAETAKLGSYKAVMRIPHGCDGQAVNAVRIHIPEGYIGVKPMPKPGWTIALEKGDYAKAYEQHGEKVTSGVKSVTWSGGELPADYFDEFVVHGTLADLELGTKLPFITTQYCKDSKVEWKEIAKQGEDPHALKTPAPLLEIVAGDDLHAGHNMAAMGGSAPADDEAVTLGALKISGAWTKAMLPGQPVGGGFLTIENTGGEADRLMSVTSEISPDVQIHEMKMDGEVMKMRQLAEGVEIPADGKLEMKPGGYHLMFMQLKAPFKEGDSVSIKLKFEKAGETEVVIPVMPANTSASK